MRKLKDRNIRTFFIAAMQSTEHRDAVQKLKQFTLEKVLGQNLILKFTDYSGLLLWVIYKKMYYLPDPIPTPLLFSYSTLWHI